MYVWKIVTALGIALGQQVDKMNKRSPDRGRQRMFEVQRKQIINPAY